MFYISNMNPNPFFFFGSADHHRDLLSRPQEESKIQQFVKNAAKVRIQGDRRVGKTTLLRKSLHRIPHLYVDFSAVKTPEGCVDRFNASLHSSKWGADLLNTSIKLGALGEFGISIQKPSFQNDPFIGLEVLLNQVESSKIEAVVIDEFQDILSLPDPNAWLWRLRSIIQNHSKTAYFFTGSIQSALHSLLDGNKAAFHKQTIQLQIDPISLEQLGPWIKRKLQKSDYTLEEGVLTYIWEMTSGITGDIQKVFYYLWDLQPKEKKISRPTIEQTLFTILQADHDSNLRIIRSLTGSQVSVARAIARFPQEKLYSSKIKSESRIHNQGTIKVAIDALQKKGIFIESKSGNLRFDDPFFKILMAHYTV